MAYVTRFAEGLLLASSALETLLGGQFTPPTQLIKPNYFDNHPHPHPFPLPYRPSKTVSLEIYPPRSFERPNSFPCNI